MSEDSRYSSLMRFLDSYDSEAGEGKQSTKPSNGTVTRSATYIWDDPSGLSLPKSSSESTASQQGIESVGNELKAKIQSLKGEINENKQIAKGLQNEYVQLTVVKERRIERKKKQLEVLFSEQERGQTEALRKQEQFIEKLAVDVEELLKKQALLDEKLQSISNDKEIQMNKALHAARLKRSRSLRQLEVEERRVLDKAVQTKLPAMKKSAADTFGPKLDELVRNGKAELARVTEEIEGRVAGLTV